MTRKSHHIAGHTYLVVQQGSTVGAIFFDDACCKYYVVRLLNSLRQYRVALHAYCVLPNAIYLLVTTYTPGGLSNLLHSMMRRYKEYYRNRFERDTQVLCHEFRTVDMSDARSALDCQLFIERQPFTVGLVEHPGTYPWTSYRGNAFGFRSSALVRHAEFSKFLEDNHNPLQRYRELVVNYSNVKTSGSHQSALPTYRSIPPTEELPRHRTLFTLH